MAAFRPAPISINGHWWRDVTDETTAGPTYSLRDVVACGGRTPWIVSSVGSNDLKPKKKIPKERPFEKFYKKKQANR